MKAEITVEDAASFKYWDDTSLVKLLEKRGLKTEGGPIAPKLTGTITVRQDLIDGSYHYEQTE